MYKGSQPQWKEIIKFIYKEQIWIDFKHFIAW